MAFCGERHPAEEHAIAFMHSVVYDFLDVNNAIVNVPHRYLFEFLSSENRTGDSRRQVGQCGRGKCERMAEVQSKPKCMKENSC